MKISENKNFKIELLLLGLQQKQFAERAGYCKQYIWEVCNGNKPVSKAILDKLNKIKKGEL